MNTLSNDELLDKTYIEYCKKIRKFQRLPGVIQKELFNTILEGGTPGAIAKRKLIQANLRLVVSISLKFLDSNMPIMDLIQEGNMGLLKAIENYNPNKGRKFSTYANDYIGQYIRRYLQNHSRFIRIPVHTLEDMNKYTKVKGELSILMNREPTQTELMDKLKFSKDKIKRLEYCINLDTISLDAPTVDGQTLADIVEDVSQSDYIHRRLDLRFAFQKALDALSNSDMAIINDRLIDRIPLSKLENKYNRSHEAIRRREKRIIKTLRGNKYINGLE